MKKSLLLPLIVIGTLCALPPKLTPEEQILDKLKLPVTTPKAFVYPAASLINDLNNLGVLAQPYNPSLLPKITTAPPLFIKYPKLQKTVPYISLGNFPTPVQQLKKLGAKIGFKPIYIKRDDLSGPNRRNSTLTKNVGSPWVQGSPWYGGNKVRKLEFELANAKAHGAKSIMTFGVVGSSSVLATAVYSHKLGMQCMAMTKPQYNSPIVREKLLMHLINGTELHYHPNNSWRDVGTINNWWEHKQLNGDFPYLIPTGVTTPLGCVGFVNAAFELKEQIKSGAAPEPDVIYIATNSMGSMAGLLQGIKAAGLKTKIIGVPVEPYDINAFKKEMLQLIVQTNELLHNADPAFPLSKWTTDDIQLNSNFAGEAYALPTKAGQEAVSLLQQTEHIKLDNTYTGKAFAAMFDDIKKGRWPGKTILFWDTYCGLDFSNELKRADWHQLPPCFHRYFIKD